MNNDIFKKYLGPPLWDSGVENIQMHLCILFLEIVKTTVKEINEKANNDDGELIAKSNKMFEQNKQSGIRSVYLEIQERTVTILNEMIGRQIEYLCKYKDDNKQKFCHFCVGKILDVSKGAGNKKWRMRDNGKK